MTITYDVSSIKNNKENYNSDKDFRLGDVKFKVNHVKEGISEKYGNQFIMLNMYIENFNNQSTNINTWINFSDKGLSKFAFFCESIGEKELFFLGKFNPEILIGSSGMATIDKDTKGYLVIKKFLPSTTVKNSDIKDNDFIAKNITKDEDIAKYDNRSNMDDIPF